MIGRRAATLEVLTPLLSFIGLGLPAGAIGVAWPYMRVSLEAPLSGLGIVIAGWTAAYFVVSTATGALSTRVRTPVLLMAACATAGAGTLGFAVASNLVVLAAASLLVGVGSGLIDATVNAQVSLTRGVRFMGWLHASWAVGAALGPPVVVGSLRATGSWRGAFLAMAILFAGVGVLVGWPRGVVPAEAPGLQSAGQKATSNRRRLLILLVGVFLLGSGIEGATGDWSFTHLTSGRSLSANTAGLSLSLFWISLAAGRMGLGMLGHRLDANRLLDVCLSTVLIGTLSFWLAPPLVSAFIALPLLGLSVSVIFPLLLSLTPVRLGRGMTAHAVGYQLAAGTLGAGGFPAVIGVFLQVFGLRLLGPILTVLAIALLMLHGLSRRVTP
ncbi:MAG TPA: MFS transporter [Candidatus Dormibacteraeota bacterium]